MRGEGATHAWVEAYIPFYGWFGLDPTNDTDVGDAHVRLAVGKHFVDCSPIKGSYRGTSNHTLDVVVSVAYEDGQTTEGEHEIYSPEVKASDNKNSFRRHQEMQMQQ
jgi:transglutaminase-like putative cysteine protease